MALQVQFASLLLLIALISGGKSSWIDILDDVYAGKDIYTANVDQLFDASLPFIREAIIENGMEPLRLSDFSEQVLPLPGKLKATIEFTDGWLQEMSQMKRASDIIAVYSNKRLVLDMNLGWKILDVNYQYLYKHLLVKRTGDLNGRFQDISARVVMSVDLDNYQIYLDSVKFTKVGKFYFKLEGRILDPLLNIGIKGVTTVFRQRVLKMAEDRGLMLFRELFADINKKIPKPDRLKKQPNLITFLKSLANSDSVY
ncbi:hypothetical protein KM043_014118 [Ampulex compressa]|nr:hypothetical protein KM043_014118 [Ampulex compressa]